MPTRLLLLAIRALRPLRAAPGRGGRVRAGEVRACGYRTARPPQVARPHGRRPGSRSPEARPAEADASVAYAVPNYVAHASASSPTTPAWRLQWNFSAPFGIGMPEAWPTRAAPARPGGRGVIVAVLDTRRRVRANRGATGARPTSPHALRARLRLRRRATAYPTTATATARTSPARSPRRPNNGIGAHRARLRRADHAARACSTPTARATPRAIAAGDPLRGPPRRRRDQPLARVRPERPRRRDPRLARRDPLRARKRRRSSSAAPATRTTPGRLPGAGDDVIAVGATTEHGCLADYSNDGPRPRPRRARRRRRRRPAATRTAARSTRTRPATSTR